MKIFRLLTGVAVSALMMAGCTPKDYSVKGNTVTVKVTSPNGETPSQVRLQVLGEKIIRVSATPDGAFHDRPSLVVLPQKGKVPFSVKADSGTVTVSTAALTAAVRISDGNLRFTGADGKTFTASGTAPGMHFTPIEVEGKRAYSTQVVFDSPEDEAFYGLGQQQTGEFNHKGLNEELYQYNTKISIPFVVSSRGYGLLFDAYSLSRWGNPHPTQQLGRVFRLWDMDGKEGALTGTYRTADGKVLVQREDSLYYENERAIGLLPALKYKGARVTYEGYLEATQEADYYFTQYYAGFQETELDGVPVMTRRWRPAWNPNSCRYTVHFRKGEKKHLKLTWEPDGDVSYLSLKVAVPQTPAEQDRLSFWSEFEPQIDFYFLAGDNYDEVIHGYRTLTGKASLFPRWSLGFWQSRERYTTQEEIVGALKERRIHGEDGLKPAGSKPGRE